jgi:hypothetical protein
MRVKNKLSGTFPIIFHSPDLNDAWSVLKSRYFKHNHDQEKIPKNLSIITWNNLEKGVLERSLDIKKIPYIKTGSGIEIWNNLFKFDLTLEAIKNCDSEYFIGLDSHDVIFLGSPKEALSKFKELGCELIFNGEMRFYPGIQNAYFNENKKFQEKIGLGSKFKFLNSGAWMGKREFCLDFFEKCSQIKIWDIFDCSDHINLYNCDQSVVHDIFRLNSDNVKIDYENNIFCNMAYFKKNNIEFQEIKIY